MTGLQTKLKNLFKKIFKVEVLIFLSALIIGLFFHFFPYNQYLINEDTRQVIYWMRQFQDQDLFTNDLLTDYAKNEHGWGFILLYYLLSFIADPMIMTKILAIVILATSSLFIFKLVKHIINHEIGLLAAIIFMTSVGTAALPRHFGNLFLLIFLYYFIKKDYLKTNILIILLSLFYPISYFLALTTYTISLIKIKNKRIFIDETSSKLRYFYLAIVISGLILASKYIFFSNPTLGSTVNKTQILADIHSYLPGSREPVLPLPGLTRTIINNAYFWKLIHLNYDKLLPNILKTISPKIIFVIIIILAFFIYKTLRPPPELLALFFAGILLYKVAELLLLKMYLPRRYIERSLPIIIFLIALILIKKILSIIKSVKIRKIIVLAMAAYVFLDFLNNFQAIKKASFSDFSYFKNVYSYLATLPKNVVIAGPPKLVDGIPTYAQRKVFFSHELAYPIYDKYWQIMKKRIYSFYNAYYSEDPTIIYQFCQDNNIDYIVVNQIHFNKDFLDKKSIYYQPFNPYLVHITQGNKNFVLANIKDEDKLFNQDGFFVVSKNLFIPSDH